MNLQLTGLPEKNNQAEIYHQLRKLGIPCYLEVKYKNCRFDIVVARDDQPLCIIEVKRGKYERKLREKDKKQIDRYSKFGVPVFFVNASRKIPKIISDIYQLYYNRPLYVSSAQEVTPAKQETITDTVYGYGGFKREIYGYAVLQ